MLLVEIKALSGSCFVRAEHVLAITQTDPARCQLVMVGGTVVSCIENVKVVAERIGSALSAAKQGQE